MTGLLQQLSKGCSSLPENLICKPEDRVMYGMQKPWQCSRLHVHVVGSGAIGAVGCVVVTQPTIISLLPSLMVVGKPFRKKYLASSSCLGDLQKRCLTM